MKNKNISTPPRTRVRSRKGGTLISIIAVMLILGVLGASVITFTHTTEHSHLSANAGSRAYYLAESGLRYAQQVYCNEPDEDLRWRHGREFTLNLLGGEQVFLIRLNDFFWSTATVDAGTAQEARATVPMPLSFCGVDPNANPADEFAIFGEIGISLGNNTVIQGDVAITDGGVDIQGDVEGSILAGDVEMTSSDATVTGDIFSSGTVDIRTGNVTGDIHAANGIILRSAQSTVFGGWLFSEGSIEVGGKSQVLGHVHSCGGNLTMDGSATIGTAAEPVEVRISGNISIGGSAKIYGTVYAGGTITGPNNSIVGDAYAGGNISPGMATVTAWPNSPTFLKEPICPDLTDLEDLDLPDATEFTAGGTDVSVPTGVASSLSPGTYGDLTSVNNTQNAEFTLNAGLGDHGNYYFDSINLGNDLILRLDLSGTYDIRIFVVGNIVFGRDLNVLVSTDGTNYTPMTDLTDDMKLALGARVYWESHGNYTLGQSSNWFGTVFTPDGSLSTNAGYLIGSFFSGGGHSLQNSTVFHVPPNYFTED